MSMHNDILYWAAADDGGLPCAVATKGWAARGQMAQKGQAQSTGKGQQHAARNIDSRDPDTVSHQAPEC